MSLTYGERTATQAMYSEFLRARVQQGESLFPTGIQGFTAGMNAERERIIAELEQGKRTLVFGPDKALVDNIIKLINKGETK